MKSTIVEQIDRLAADALEEVRKEIPNLSTEEEMAYRNGFKEGVLAILLRQLPTKTTTH